MLLSAPCLFSFHPILDFLGEGTPFGGGTHKKTALVNDSPSERRSIRNS